jgi:hypothetical protein
MTRAPFIVIDGKLYRWKDILELRRAQLAAAGAAQGSQLALFAALHDDRPATRRAQSIRALSATGLVRKLGRASAQPSLPCRGVYSRGHRKPPVIPFPVD